MRIVQVCLFILISMPVSLSAQHFTKRDLNISAGYGIGNVWKSFLKDAITVNANYTVSANGPYCLLIDYAPLKQFSVGVALGYSVTKGAGDFNGFAIKERLNSFSALLRANYHYVRFNKFDPYVGGGIGYYHFRYSNDLNLEKPNSVPGNLGYSLQLGVRYYLNPHLSVYSELGYIAGSLAQVGLSYKVK